MKHLERYILREALKSVNIKEQEEGWFDDITGPVKQTYKDIKGATGGNIELDTGIKIGSPEWFAPLGYKMRWGVLKSFISRWHKNKLRNDNIYAGIKTIKPFMREIILNLDNEFWKKVHSAPDAVKPGTLSDVFKTAAEAYGLTDWSPDQIIDPQPELMIGDPSVKSSFGKQEINDVRLQMVRSWKDIAEKKDNDVDALDDWSIPLISTWASADEKTFYDYFAPDLAMMYLQFLSWSVIDAEKARAERERAEKAKEIKTKGVEVATTAPIVPGGEIEISKDKVEEPVEKPAEEPTKIRVKRSGVASSAYAESLAEEAGTSLSAVQEDLLEFGLFDKPKDQLKTFESGTADGIYGPETEAAIINLQEKLNKLYKDNPQVDSEFEELEEDGLYGPLTHNALTKMISKLGRPAVALAMKGSS